ncbi:uncharacterized protein MYCGRDRAFT_105493 [Zymoseptoria tritici IPO323]|uniref:Uncharacterized protein n=1 Tax=Zymoseptoria tritici (strain CBS 115943 / IPO323) TaxID=336722 RepID=F9XI00_ZYMTI|nr:uncharacterized protein MYCGRDRAFT_105493 [Zymoseptoria tritici IPO323]EGP85041.1 hypothetical protein MYCGRDRAFT_105493 [Zymoseptoria tritici IPO323]
MSRRIRTQATDLHRMQPCLSKVPLEPGSHRFAARLWSEKIAAVPPFDAGTRQMSRRGSPD